MREANSPIHPDDLPTLTRNHQAYLDDEEGLTTNAAKLQDDAYALGYRRARQQGVPDGWTLVPIDPTPAMRLVGARDCSALIQPDQAEEAWRAMLCAVVVPFDYAFAAPSAPAKVQGDAVKALPTEPTFGMVQAACAAFRLDISPMKAMHAALCAAIAAAPSVSDKAKGD